MFFHNLKYSLKTLFRNKPLMFWTFAFPIILVTFFNMAFSDIEKNDKLKVIDVAIVQNENLDKNKIFKEAFDELSDSNNDDRLFNTKYTDEEEAKKLLEEQKIKGYIKLVDDEPKLFFSKSNVSEAIIKNVSEEIIQTSNIVSNLTEKEVKKEIEKGNFNVNAKSIANNIIKKYKDSKVTLKNISSNNLSYTKIEFYTLIAMACLYGGMLGCAAMNQILANMTKQGKRVSVSSASKGKLILSSVLASYITQLIGISLLFVYIIFVLKFDFGPNLPLQILLTLLGSFAGLSLGVAVSSTLKGDYNKKTGILIIITMLGCFLSGMMGITMKYVVDKNVPILNKINPANMITDGFYSLYYYDTLDRYLYNINGLLVFSLILIIISYISLRRQKYEYI